MSFSWFMLSHMWVSFASGWKVDCSRVCRRFLDMSRWVMLAEPLNVLP